MCRVALIMQGEPVSPNSPGIHIPSEEKPVTYVICQPCIGVKDASCVDVCPVDCIHAREEDEQYFIDPDECIDCGACEPVCPVTAIFADSAVPAGWRAVIPQKSQHLPNEAPPHTTPDPPPPP